MSKDFPFSHFLKTTAENQPNPHVNTNNNKSLDLGTQSPSTPMFNAQTPSEKPVDASTWSTEELKMMNTGIDSYLQTNLSPEKYNAFFKDNLSLKNLTQDTAQFEVPTPLIKTMIEGQFKDFLLTAMTGTLGKPYKIELIVKNQPVNTTQEHSSGHEQSNARTASFKLDLNQTTEDKKSSIESTYMDYMDSDVGGMTIDPSKTFDNFIVGPSNNLAFATASAVGQNPGKEGKYPCLYIYSDSGLGKTHLLQAVANAIHDNNPEMIICLISAREFMKEMINAVKDKSIDKFQKKYCETIDVLMIDDIHQLKNKAGTQEEFFHIFNALHSAGKQLIFTSDKSPKEIDGIEERIITRLQWGLVIDIQRPDLETRAAILKKKALELDLFVQDDVINLIASSVKTSIRELEGNLIRLRASADLMDVELDTEMVKDLLNLNISDEGREITLEVIAKATSQFFKIPLADLKSKSRNKDIVKARHIAWYLSKKLIDATLKDIAKFYGGRDHSSVIHGINKITEQIREDRQISKDLTYLENNL